MRDGFLFIDESGDTGVSSKSSKFLVLAGIYCSNPRKLEHVAKKIWRKYTSVRKHGEIHAYKITSDKIIIEALRLLSEIDIEIIYIAVRKNEIKRNRSNLYYSMLEHLAGESGVNPDRIFVDKKDNDGRREQISRKYNLSLVGKINFKDSRSSKEIQMVDLVAWSIFSSYEHRKDEYLNIINHKINFKKESFPL